MRWSARFHPKPSSEIKGLKIFPFADMKYQHPCTVTGVLKWCKLKSLNLGFIIRLYCPLEELRTGLKVCQC